MDGGTGKFPVEDFDWLAYAIGRISGDGGLRRAAKALGPGISHETLRQWLKSGVYQTRHGKVARLSELSGVRMESLRLGKWHKPFNLPAIKTGRV